MVKRWIPSLSIILASISLTACSPDEAASAAAVPPEQAEQTIEIATVPDDPDPALWVLKDEDTTIYLFGTVHLLKPGMTWFDEAVRDAFDKSDELVVEMLDPDPAVMAQIVSDLAIDKTGVSVRNKMNAKDRAAYEAALTKLKIPLNSFDPLEPWFVSVNLSLIPLMANGYDASRGVEDDLTALAKTRKMTIIGLETPRQQIGFFDNLPEDVQIRFLNFTVNSMDEMADGMENMVAQWALGNVDTLGDLMNAGLNEKILYDTLLANRNAEWAKWVENRMKKPGTVFFAVGAGHLAGKSSVQDMLKKKDIVAKRIEY